MPDRDAPCAVNCPLVEIVPGARLSEPDAAAICTPHSFTRTRYAVKSGIPPRLPILSSGGAIEPYRRSLVRAIPATEDIEPSTRPGGLWELSCPGFDRKRIGCHLWSYKAIGRYAMALSTTSSAERCSRFGGQKRRSLTWPVGQAKARSSLSRQPSTSASESKSASMIRCTRATASALFNPATLISFTGPTSSTGADVRNRHGPPARTAGSTPRPACASGSLHRAAAKIRWRAQLAAMKIAA
ncbi:hypothetical protein DWB77_00708 [Streptomyces hundungensis]|uniref:Uncharacterized protein n=1 Tax=Streptomyces hundungensis TaxID=1077946 RepID=A0A387HCB4_9ACTN|nr:hypothetical protein DWB77_00708 [Streptomyces hundungensis]